MVSTVSIRKWLRQSRSDPGWPEHDAGEAGDVKAETVAVVRHVTLFEEPGNAVGGAVRPRCVHCGLTKDRHSLFCPKRAR